MAETKTVQIKMMLGDLDFVTVPEIIFEIDVDADAGQDEIEEEAYLRFRDCSRDVEEITFTDEDND